MVINSFSKANAYRLVSTLLIYILLMPGLSSAAVPIVNQEISVSSIGIYANQSVAAPTNAQVMSGDGRYRVFASAASNLVPNDTNSRQDVFLRDTQLGTTERISVTSTGGQLNYDSTSPTISYDGKYAAFATVATLHTGPTNGAKKVYRKNLQTGAIYFVSTSATGMYAYNDSDYPIMSADGRFVTFNSYASNLVAGSWGGTSSTQVYIKDVATAGIKALSRLPNGTSASGYNTPQGISCDGGVVSFTSADRLVDNDTSYLKDIYIATIGINGEVISGASVGGDKASSASSVSCNGVHVGVGTTATNFIWPTGGSYVYNRANSLKTIVTSPSGSPYAPALSDDASIVVYTSGVSYPATVDTNGKTDIFVKNMITGATELVSRNQDYAHGQCSEPALSGDVKSVSYHCVDAANALFRLVPSELNNGLSNVYVSKTGY
jgi:hypothetical protein